MADARIPRALTIAGSDSGGGAGIQADLKTFTALGVYGMSAVTSITAQNTTGVARIHDLPPTLVAEQIKAVATDLGLDAAKTGMLSNVPIIEAVAEAIAAHGIAKLVVDPVMIAKGGAPLLNPSALEAMKQCIVSIALVVTPNIPETIALSGMTIENRADLQEAAARIYETGPRYVLIKGGHFEAVDVTDYLYDGVRLHEFTAPRIDTKNTHGTGCTYSAAIAAYLAKGDDVPTAVRKAKEYLTHAIRRSFDLGAGHGPLNHFWNLGNTPCA